MIEPDHPVYSMPLFKNILLVAASIALLPGLPKSVGGQPSAQTLAPATRPALERAAEPLAAISFNQALSWQIALEREGFSPGLIDGKIGRKTRLATAYFQAEHQLPVTGLPDPATWNRLQPTDPEAILGDYCVTESDLQQVTGVPQLWTDKAKMKFLGYESLDCALAERFHCTRELLARLNPGTELNTLAAGQSIRVPVLPAAHQMKMPAPSKLEINLQEKTIRCLGDNQQTLALFHCSIAADKAKRPTGQATIRSVTTHPNYLFDPAKWPEVKESAGRLIIPPGPRNPVGLCWIQLSLPGYGIHGTPRPQMIGKTGSHGCFRLTNWDALRLGKMVQAGCPVTFITDASPWPNIQ